MTEEITEGMTVALDCSVIIINNVTVSYSMSFLFYNIIMY